LRTLVWYRGKDLRVADHAPLRAACRGELIPVFVLDDYFFAPRAAQRTPFRIQFLLESMASLAANLEHLAADVDPASQTLTTLPSLESLGLTHNARVQPGGEHAARERMPAKHIHAPWLAPQEVLAAAGVRLGANYPRPIVEHAAARQRFLATAKKHLG
jgi:deoxyribodipyrimidine photolyase